MTISVQNSPNEKPSYEQHIDENDISSSYLESWNVYARNKKALVHELKHPGDVIEVPIELTIPSKNDESEPEIPASVSLLIRLADEEDEDINTVALFRGPGMVVNSYPLNKLSLTQRPFHAIVVCGEARIPPSESDSKLDSFLRAAEPPSHNDWAVTKRLKEIYRPGYRKLLEELKRKVRDEIKKQVSEKTPKGSEGPQLLKKLFPLENIGTLQQRYPTHFRVSNQFAELQDGVWNFSGVIKVNPDEIDDHNLWVSKVDLRFRAEDGKDSSGGFVNKFQIDKKSKSKGASLAIKNGIGVITANSSIRKVRFTGETDPNQYPVQSSQSSVEIYVKSSWNDEE